MPTDPFIEKTADLRALGGRRVWSLMISLFGDLAQKESQVIDGPVLSEIMNALQIKPEATRVALHRLRNDGWIVSHKSGRISQHSLSAKGLQESAAASPRIYAQPKTGAAPWRLVIARDAETVDAEEMRLLGFTAVAPRIFVGSAMAKPPREMLSFEGTESRAWLSAQLEPQAQRAGYTDLLKILTGMQKALGRADTLSPTEVAVLRCLIVHNWRRLVLKHPPLPLGLLRAEWPGHQCHLAVHDLLARFPRPDLTQINAQRAVA